MSNENIEMIDEGIVEVLPKQNDGALFDTSLDNIIYLADRAEKAIQAVNRIMEAALKITNEKDWVIIGGKPYLQETGATKVSSLFGISIQLAEGYPKVSTDHEGYKTYSYRARLSAR